PDLTILLDAPLEVSAQRGRTSGDRFERMGEAFRQRVRQGYLALAAAEPERIVVVDASRPIEWVTGEVWKHVGSLLRRWRDKT
ncbi:MAG: hypothetical protein IRY95_10000, partial [Clostridia bacterium]|nr:hypothetical protein [Clostridia bacterium]